jgi:hypothetical protein
MASRGGPDFSSPTLDFLATIRAKERLGAFAILDESDRGTLESLLRRYHAEGATAALEREARTFLISYREMDKHAGVLDREERGRLGEILNGTPASETARGPVLPRARWFIAAAVCVLAAGVGTGSYIASHQSGPPPAVAAQHPAVQLNVPPGNTELQNLRQDYGPWRQLATSGQQPGTGTPALLLLEDGGYWVSERWTIPPAATGWQNDMSGTVASAAVTGARADITDADGNSYIVGINQPFIISSNPAAVLLIDTAGTVRSMSLAHATAVRHSLGR